MKKPKHIQSNLIEDFAKIKNHEDAVDRENRTKERQEKLIQLASMKGKGIWEGDLIKMREGRF